MTAFDVSKQPEHLREERIAAIVAKLTSTNDPRLRFQMLLQGAIESVAHELRREIPAMNTETMLYSLWHELPEPEKVLRSAKKSVLRMPPIEYEDSLNINQGASVVDRIFEAVRLDLRLTLIRKLARKAEKMTNTINSANDTAKVRVVHRVITRLPAIEEDN